ncbi:phage protein Gp36 family protein [Niabella insulamsoli]|uniref:phage protein Gp36 family protein n=1 Tax=Niabella insulamsoli TaxID=3144874 RepID=UPI0031FD26C5
MAFLTADELKDAIYEYQVDQITDGDDNIVVNAISAATDEVRSYLTGNRKKEWDDGRLRYDVDAIFDAAGVERNALILAHTKTIAKWWIILLANPDIIYEQVKERYDRSVAYLKMVAKGDVTIGSLPVITPPAPNPDTDDPNDGGIAIWGSRPKFNHE